VVKLIESLGFELSERVVVPDEQVEIAAQLTKWVEMGIDLICTTGGTGVSQRDVTPEATRKVIDQEIPGMAEAMRAGSLDKTPFAMISRAVAGVAGRTLVINLPGNPKGVAETLEILLPVIPHTVEVLRERGDPHEGGKHRSGHDHEHEH
jgi:molybdopterin adenylyltransferase